MVHAKVIRLDGEQWSPGHAEVVGGFVQTSSSMTYVFLDGEFDNEVKWAQLFHDYHASLKPPSLFGYRVFWDGNGHFGHQVSLDEENKSLQTCNTQFRCLIKKAWNPDNIDQTVNKIDKVKYKWNEMTFLTYWNDSSSVMFCLNTPASFEESLLTTLNKEDPAPLDCQDPFAMYVPLIDEIVKLYDESVWSIRDVLRRIEKIREKANQNELNLQYQSDFSEFQEIMRHSIHVGEVLSVSAKTVGEMLQWREELLQLRKQETGSSLADIKWRIQDKPGQRLKLHVQILGNLKHRQESTHERLRTEISLAYNLGTQRDSRILKADSRAMKTVASLTMVYLPATFVSAIFSMSFFNFSPADGDKPERWTHSRRWWLFLVAAAAATVVTVLIWYILQNMELEQLAKDLISIRWWKYQLKRIRRKRENSGKAAEA